MSGRFFLDSNVILYSADTGTPEYRAIAKELMRRRNPAPVISTQVMQETFVNARKKYQMSFAQARHFLVQISQFTVVTASPALVFNAVDLTARASLSFWDALIIATAIEGGCDTLYTEDLNHGQVIAGVRVVNPFKQETA